MNLRGLGLLNVPGAADINLKYTYSKKNPSSWQALSPNSSKLFVFINIELLLSLLQMMQKTHKVKIKVKIILTHFLVFVRI